MQPACGHDPTYLVHHDCRGNSGGIHALVIGVGRYHKAAPRFGTRLKSLPGAALAGHRVVKYLINEFQFQEPYGRRLATLRLLLSPLKRERDLVRDLEYGPAERKEVSVALQDWANDCNANDQNLAVLYVAGHGVALKRSTSLFFLADAPTERSLALAAINLRLTQRRMRQCTAKNDLFFYDCCAVPADAIPSNHAGALSINPFSEGSQESDGTGRRVNLVCVNAARVGRSTFAIGTEGTLLARGLLGAYRDKAGDDALPRIAGDDALLRIAGELDTNGAFRITPARLEEMLSPRLRTIAADRNVPAKGYEASLTGSPGPGPITVPDPPPRFEVVLEGLRNGRTPPVSVNLLTFEGETIPLTNDANDVEVWQVPAGNYTVFVSGSSGELTPGRLDVTGPIQWAAPA